MNEPRPSSWGSGGGVGRWARRMQAAFGALPHRVSAQGQAVRLLVVQETTRNCGSRMRLAQWQKPHTAKVGDKVGKTGLWGTAGGNVNWRGCSRKQFGTIWNTVSALGTNPRCAHMCPRELKEGPGTHSGGGKKRCHAQHPTAGGQPVLEEHSSTSQPSSSSPPTPYPLTGPLQVHFYQPTALPSRGKQNSHVKTERQTPRKAFQCPFPRRRSHYNGAWTSATSPERGKSRFHST